MALAGLLPVLIPLLTLFFLILFVRRRLFWRMAARNFLRHRKHTLLASLGFVMGTVIITSSLVMGDTLGSMVESLLYDALWEIDEAVAVRDPAGDELFFTLDQGEWLVEEISKIEAVEAAAVEITLSAAVVDEQSQQFEPAVNLHALESDSFFARFRDTSGKVPLPREGVLIVESLAEDLMAEEGDQLTIFTEYGNFTSEVYRVVKGELRGGQGGIFININYLWETLNLTPSGNIILISNRGGVKGGMRYSEEVVRAIEALLEEASHPSGYPFQVVLDKKESVENMRKQLESVSTLFLVFGSFSIIAGLVLIVNIFVMLAEERRVEMGIMRAVGMKQGELARVYTAEGSFYGALAAVLGVPMGLLASYVLMSLFSRIIQNVGGEADMLRYYTFTPTSILLGASGGFILSIAAVIFISIRVSKLEIASAIRDLPPSPIPRGERKITVLGGVFLLLGALLTLAGMRLEAAWGPLTGISLITVGSAFVLRRFLGDRIPFTLMGIVLLIWWFMPTPSIFEGYSGGMDLFVLSGIFTTFAGITIIVFNSDILLCFVEKLSLALKRSPAPVKIAISYPHRKPFRTSVTIFVFALVTFTITVMTVLNGVFVENKEAILEQQSGGYDIFAMCFLRPGEGVEEEIEESFPEVVAVDSAVSGSAIMLFRYGRYTFEYPLTLYGVNSTFAERNSFSFSEVEEGLTEKEAWGMVIRGEGAILGMGGGGMGGSIARAGDLITLKNLRGEEVKLEVVGVLSSFILGGVIVSREVAEDAFNITAERMFFLKTAPGADKEHISQDLERTFIRYGMNVIVVEDIVDQVLMAQSQIFDLFNVFLGLGLIVGVAGLGIVTSKSIHERRHEIGVMRAIGFRRRGVVKAFLIEQSYISTLGIGLGMILGAALGYMIWNNELSEVYPEFSFPIAKLLIIAAIAFSVAFLSIIPSARGAAKVEPAEALRYE